MSGIGDAPSPLSRWAIVLQDRGLVPFEGNGHPWFVAAFVPAPPKII